MTLIGGVDSLVINEQGDIAWEFGEQLFVNDDLIISDGDAVDIDGDGEPNPEWVVERLTTASVLVLGDRELDGSMDLVFTVWLEHPVTSELLSTLFVLSYKDHFVEEGFALAGVAGLPSLQATGFLEGGDPLTLTLKHGKPSGAATLFLGFAPLFAPFKGGTLVPVPNLILPGFPLNSAGSLVLESTWPDGVPAGVTVYLQFWMAEAAAIKGVSATNGISFATP